MSNTENFNKVNKKLSPTKQKLAYFAEGKFEELIKTVSLTQKIKLFKESKVINFETNFYEDLVKETISPLYTQKNGFSIPQENFVKQFFAYNQSIAEYLLLNHNIAKELTYSRLFKTHILAKLDEPHKTELRQQFLAYFEENNLTSKPFIGQDILDAYLKNKKELNSDSNFFNNLIIEIFEKPLTNETVRAKINLFKKTIHLPEYAKQFIPMMDECLIYVKNLSRKDLETKYIWDSVEPINEIFSTMEQILGEEGLLKHIRLNKYQIDDAYYSNIRELHKSHSTNVNDFMTDLFVNNSKSEKIKSMVSQAANTLFPQYYKKDFYQTLQNDSYFNNKLKMPLPKLKDYFLLLKKTGELEQLKNYSFTLPFMYFNEKMLPVLEKIVFLEQMGISIKTEIVVEKTGEKLIIDFKNNYLTPIMNELKDNNIETNLTIDLLNNLREKHNNDFAKKFSTMKEELKTLMVNTDNLFKRKII